MTPQWVGVKKTTKLGKHYILTTEGHREVKFAGWVDFGATNQYEWWIYGTLGKDIRKPMPYCVKLEIAFHV